MIVILPINKFRVAYELAKGRPYSPLEKRVLERIDEGPVSLAELDDIFMIHQRLIVEAIVTLVGAGWVAVSSGPTTRFVSTAEGHAALTRERGEPVSVVVTPARPQVLLVERISGQIARQRGMRTYRRDDLGDVWEASIRIPPRIFRNSIDEARVQKLLPRDTGEWIRWIGPMWLISKNQHYLPVDVDLSTGEVRGLPPSWRSHLGPIMVEYCRDYLTEHRGVDLSRSRAIVDNGSRGSPLSEDSSAPEPGREMFDVVFDSADIVRGTAAHEALLQRYLTDSDLNVFVASPEVSLARLDALGPLISTAVSSGVRVDILCGGVTAPDEFSRIVDATHRLGYDAAGSRSGRSLLRSGGRPTGSGACLLIGYSDRTFTACVGNYPWLGASTSDTLSIEVTDSRLVGELSRVAASLWDVSSPDGSGAAGDRWRHLASLSEEVAAKENVPRASGAHETTQMSVIVDDEHLFVPDRPGVVRIGNYAPNEERELSCDGVSLLIEGRGADVVGSPAP